ncbi:hypothetical protein EDD69_101258 [Thermolongibacillus altinsuensis]|uniref:Repressor Rok winged helix domain-containing protein n=1 Tax=Thermolongibacillus altinsuensis TaxID=575256 RepID=A0A4R1QT30_9BACL|nr:hypothetical protein [Thermolongibacillus altinsuensis]TCL53250.1 hypothetical protein EDD69_101258 [Thermolongibacillus altinsuensis]
MNNRKTNQSRVVEEIIKLLTQHPEGLRYSQIKKSIENKCPDIHESNIKNVIPKLEQFTDQVKKIDRGYFKHINYISGTNEFDDNKGIAGEQKIKEEYFYDAFAEWLENEIEECSKAISLGGNILRKKWGTPDVIGIREYRSIIPLPTEIVSAEIKIDTNQLITGFGQACSYKLFSHKTYLVLPDDSPEEDIRRIDALCRINDIGLILFNKLDPENPNFQIRARANKNEPDMFYVNEIINELRYSRLFK